MHSVLSRRRSQMTLSIRRKYLQQAFQHARKEFVQKDQVQEVNSDTLQNYLLELNIQLIRNGIEGCKDQLKEMVQWTKKSKDLGTWLRMNTISIIINYLIEQETLQISCTYAILLTIDRLVARNQQPSNSQKIIDLKVMPSLISFLNSAICEPALHLISNLCGDSYRIRDLALDQQILQTIFIAKQRFMQNIKQMQTLSFAISNLARNDKNDISSFCKRRYVKHLAILAAELLMIEDYDIIINASHALRFLSNSNLFIEDITFINWPLRAIQLIQARHPCSQILMAVIGNSTEYSRQYAQDFVRIGLLQVMSDIVFFPFVPKVQQLQMKLVGWTLSNMCQAGNTVVDSMLVSPLLFKYPELILTFGQAAKIQWRFWLCSLFLNVNIHQLGRLLAHPWIFDQFSQILDSTNVELVQEGLKALLGMSKQSEDWITPQGRSMSLVKIEEHAGIIHQIQSLTTHSEKQIRQLSERWIQFNYHNSKTNDY